MVTAFAFQSDKQQVNLVPARGPAHPSDLSGVSVKSIIKILISYTIYHKVKVLKHQAKICSECWYMA